MATIKLGRYESKMGDLPRVCLRCGEAASEYREHVFSHSPWWIYLAILPGLIPFLVLSILLNRRLLVRVPLCDEHVNHWRWRQLVLLAGLVLPGLALLFFMAIEVLTGGRFFSHEEMGKLSALTTLIFVVLVVWLAVAIALKLTAIHETKIARYSITLTGVADEFVEALRVHRALATGQQLPANDDKGYPTRAQNPGP
jgi:hypothetical protein